MQLLFGKSKWEMGETPLDPFLQRAVADGFDAVEVFIPGLAETPEVAAAMIRDNGLELIAQITTEGRTPSDHLDCLRSRFTLAARTSPRFINSHTGRDHFAFADNVHVFEEATRLSHQTGIPITHETHRGRPLFAAHETLRYLEAVPDLRLNADFSHWFCVHESDLSDQPHNVAIAIDRSHYIHARVGFEEGPQVGDPLAPWIRPTLDRFLSLWRRILAARRAEGWTSFLITPEFGPPPYLPCHPQTGQPLGDAWEINQGFHQFLKQTLASAPCQNPD